MLTKLLTKYQMMKDRDSKRAKKKRLLTALTAKSLVEELLGALAMLKTPLLLVPKRGLEPLQAYTH